MLWHTVSDNVRLHFRARPLGAIRSVEKLLIIFPTAHDSSSREFSHRVKSISMSKFADHEIGVIIGDKGNEVRFVVKVEGVPPCRDSFGVSSVQPFAIICSLSCRHSQDGVCLKHFGSILFARNWILLKLTLTLALFSVHAISGW